MVSFVDAGYSHCSTAILILGSQISGKVVGFLGLGRIGKATAKRVYGFNPGEMIYHSRHEPKFDPSDVHEPYLKLLKPATFEEFLASSDIIFICTDLNPSTYHLFNSDTFKVVKRGVILVNTARGGIVDTKALISALDNGQVGGVALDVTEPEPLPSNHPIVTNYGNRVILAPHLGSSTQETRDAMGLLAIDNLEAGLLGQPLPATMLN
ncbi:hypothetical protein DSO57_1021230 [Entomophthora muscae]|uniref:Uncharacterized protein n=1 Tax=Entomophthora muscae TaxID=34485 RepID=A0ACC2UDC4_9FUNG|nr:hypothetical protein DSO57_1021230 [Entomophthora muscae]